MIINYALHSFHGVKNMLPQEKRGLSLKDHIPVRPFIEGTWRHSVGDVFSMLYKCTCSL